MNRSPRSPKVIHEDNHLIVIDKPPLLATMGARKGETSLVEWTRQWLKEKYNKPGNVYLGVVSRLDAFTSGLIVIAKTSKAAARMTHQFQQGVVDKTYTAIVEGRLSETEGHWVDWVRKDDRLRRMIVAESGARNAKRAELQYRLRGVHGQWSLVTVQLYTGRKHQIRVQFSSRGAPILGDRKYEAKHPFKWGIALLASSLAFEHPVKRKKMSFQVDPPSYWKIERFEPK